MKKKQSVIKFCHLAFCIFFPLLSLGLLTGCGTTSGLGSADSGPETTLSSKRYEMVLVNPVSTEGARTDATPQRVALAGEELRGMIVSQIQNTGAFQSVVTEGETNAGTLILDTRVTRYEDGNAVARLMVGFGAGSSRFDARFDALDGNTNKQIGSMIADKNSWVLGGGLAAGQDADSYMPGIAKKVAQEIAPMGVNYRD